MVSDGVLVLMGCYLLFYRAIIRQPGMRSPVIVLAQLVVGCSLVVFAPMATELKNFRVPVLCLIGCLFSCVGSWKGLLLQSLIVSTTTGMGLYCALWHLGLCNAMDYFAVGASLVILIMTVVFYYLGKDYEERVQIPILGTMLLMLGLAGLVPQFGLLHLSKLMTASPLVDVGATLKFVALWLLACLGAIPVQIWMMKPVAQAKRGGGELPSVMQRPANPMERSLISEEMRDDPDPDVQDKVRRFDAGADGDATRHMVLMDAICADASADVSHLTEEEQALVGICQSDEFERDRIMWGGGLI